MIHLNKAKHSKSNPIPVILAVLSILLALPQPVTRAEDSAQITECEIVVDDLIDGINSGWSSKSFKGKTEYTWASEEGRTFIRAISNGTASGLYYEIKYDPKTYPYITWKWKVDNIIASGDASIKSGDDYGARLYVVFPSFFFWNTKAINYIWANKLPEGQMILNPYTSNNIMISVESGSSEIGKWITETRNVYEDYKRAFGREPPEVGAIAIMTDSDDTGESASADYGPIAICSRDPRK